MSRFLEALRSGRVLLMDGAMGTELQRAGIQEGDCYELWNLTHPERVQAVHDAYFAAGAEVLLTNSFQLNPVALNNHGQEPHLETLQEAAVALARCAIGPAGFVLVDVGPVPMEMRGSFSEIGQWLQRVAAGSRQADGFLLETYSGWMVTTVMRELRAWRGTFKHSRDLPILLSLAYLPPYGGFYGALDGQALETLAHWSHDSGAAALGVNCGRDIGMDEIIEIIRRYRQATDLPLFARPNAGTPVRDGDRWLYPHAPEMMAARLPELLEAGVSMIGGCCGTTPEHIAAFRPIVDAWNARSRR